MIKKMILLVVAILLMEASMTGCSVLEKGIDEYSKDKEECVLNTDNVTQFTYKGDSFTILDDTLSNSELGEWVGYIRKLAVVDSNGKILLQQDTEKATFKTLDDILGVEEERGFNLNTDKYNWDEHRDHFILQDTEGDVDFGEGKKNIFALPETEILIHKNQEVQMAVKTFGKGRGVYISGLPYSFENSRVLYRAVLWSASAEKELYCWYSSNYNVEVHAYVKNKKYCVVNNTYEPQDTTVYIGDGGSFELHMEPNEIKWYQIQ